MCSVCVFVKFGKLTPVLHSKRNTPSNSAHCIGTRSLLLLILQPTDYELLALGLALMMLLVPCISLDTTSIRYRSMDTLPSGVSVGADFEIFWFLSLSPLHLCEHCSWHSNAFLHLCLIQKLSFVLVLRVGVHCDHCLGSRFNPLLNGKLLLKVLDLSILLWAEGDHEQGACGIWVSAYKWTRERRNCFSTLTVILMPTL